LRIIPDHINFMQTLPFAKIVQNHLENYNSCKKDLQVIRYFKYYNLQMVS
jgi:hypothetical protein